MLSDGALVAAVADGAGSAEFADQGAKVVVESVVRSVSASLESGRSDAVSLLVEAATTARQDVLALAETQNTESRQFASTLLAVVATPGQCAALQVGDGVIVVSDGGRGWCWMFWPQRGEYANTTRFLTDEDALTALQVESFNESVTDIALMTDGLEPLALHYATKSVHEPFFQGMFAPLVKSEGKGRLDALSSALEAFLGGERVAARTDDDVSLVMATRRVATSDP